MSPIVSSNTTKTQREKYKDSLIWFLATTNQARRVNEERGWEVQIVPELIILGLFITRYPDRAFSHDNTAATLLCQTKPLDPAGINLYFYGDIVFYFISKTNMAAFDVSKNAL